MENAKERLMEEFDGSTFTDAISYHAAKYPGTTNCKVYCSFQPGLMEPGVPVQLHIARGTTQEEALQWVKIMTEMMKERWFDLTDADGAGEMFLGFDLFTMNPDGTIQRVPEPKKRNGSRRK